MHSHISFTHVIILLYGGRSGRHIQCTRNFCSIQSLQLSPCMHLYFKKMSAASPVLMRGEKKKYNTGKPLCSKCMRAPNMLFSPTRGRHCCTCFRARLSALPHSHFTTSKYFKNSRCNSVAAISTALLLNIEAFFSHPSPSSVHPIEIFYCIIFLMRVRNYTLA